MQALAAALDAERLVALGGLAPGLAPPELLPQQTQSLLLIGPDTPRFWPHFTASPEYSDGAPDPMDRWSKRILNTLAKRFDGEALFPSDGPPYPPFYAWALQSGAFFVSPISLLVHPRDGLMCSLRGALALPFPQDVPGFGPSPCDSCDGRPCLQSCPVGAFETGQYAVATCHNHLDTPAGSDCMGAGCAARRVCPASQRSGRDPAQSAFHMRAFHGKR